MKELFLDVETTGTWLDGKAFSQKTKSGGYYYWDDLTEIADNIKKDEIHFRYQSSVYLGVADLKILFEFSISSGENLGSR